jgi:hypothetical protein
VKPANYWKQVREVCDKATAGPWKHVYVPGRRTPGWPGEPGNHRLVPNGHMWAPIDAHDPDSEDAAFIAVARTALPEALDEIERLRTALERAVDLLIIVPRDTDDEDKIDEVATVIHAALGNP